MTALTLVIKSCYRDSVALLMLARTLRATAGVSEVAALMATDANKALMAQSDLLTSDAAAAGPNDLVVVIRATSAGEAERAVGQAADLLSAARRPAEAGGRPLPRTLESARRHLRGANLALISVPGAFAAAETLKALRGGLHVMLFSDNVPIDDEVALKRLAARKGLLLMGPDCGTAYLGGVPLGFANAVPRGRVGIVAASGTGLQQVAILLAARGEGISHALGVGGRDMSAAVGGLMTLPALRALAADRATELIVVVGKPPDRAVRESVIGTLRELGTPAVLAMLGRGVEPGQDGAITTVTTLEDAATAAIAMLRGKRWSPEATIAMTTEARIEETRKTLTARQRAIRGLYAGGTLAHEAALILESLLGDVSSNLKPGVERRHHIVDLGADEFTVGRAHPMLDPGARIDAIARAAKDPEVAVLLLDVVLGYGVAADPAGDIVPALEAARAEAAAHGRGLAVVTTVVGTRDDPQGLAGQIARLEAAGAWVLPSNAEAVRVAARLATG
ncbi:MAG TPA: acyl-CoA synthetase FdrA [Candidatus Methylomirabilis sp.]|nr:acyl-CoA synthetase FdrA [Candidatus Methylomirabilis sp.]